MLKQVGLVYGWDGSEVEVAVSDLSEYLPGLGDLLYVVDDGRELILQVVGFKGSMDIKPLSLYVSGEIPSDVIKGAVVRASLFLEIAGGKHLWKPVRPPQPLRPVYLLNPVDDEAGEVLDRISALTSKGSEGVTLAFLRSGSYQYEGEHRYPRRARIKVRLSEMLSKHVLLAGQTGSGKTTGLKGLIVRYALESKEKIGWLIVDRHGEYAEKYNPGNFTGFLLDALYSNDKLRDVRVKAYKLASRQGEPFSHGYFELIESPFTASSVGINDFKALLEDVAPGPEYTDMLEEMVQIVANILHVMRLQGGELEKKVASVFFSNESELEPNGNLLALLPLLYDNMIRYEGVGRREKSGLLKILVDKGIYTNHIRIIRRYILSIMRWVSKPMHISSGKTQPASTVKYTTLNVLDDSRSVIKVNSLLKKPESLIVVLRLIEKFLHEAENVQGANYPWKNIGISTELDFSEEGSVSFDRVIEEADEGGIVILDVSLLSREQADLVALTVARRLFEKRFSEGVLGVEGKPVVVLVSEEAPLYLSPEKVRSPFNSFARIAREGRKFKIGLIAVSQLASIIEKQILGNFNTIIALRSKSRSDIELLSDIGIPSETLPFLSDREGYLYSPDLPIKEPIPVYMPAWYEHKKDIEAVREGLRKLEEFKERPGDILL